MPGEEVHSTGTVPMMFDTEHTLLAKQLTALNNGGGGGGGAWVGSDSWLVAAVSGSMYQMTTSVRDGNGTVLSGTVLWPDGTAGVFTTLVIDPTFLAIDSYSVTYPALGKTVTQPAVTRDGNGGVIVSPALVVS